MVTTHQPPSPALLSLFLLLCTPFTYTPEDSGTCASLKCECAHIRDEGLGIGGWGFLYAPARQMRVGGVYGPVGGERVTGRGVGSGEGEINVFVLRPPSYALSWSRKVFVRGGIRHHTYRKNIRDHYCFCVKRMSPFSLFFPVCPVFPFCTEDRTLHISSNAK